ncbi:MAG: NAD-dependent epimerase/dehydratase family protein [Saprospiraceae bacterium]
MKVIVTGADGMLGSNIVKELVSKGHEVSTYVLPNSRILFPKLNLKRYEGNILDAKTLTQSVDGHDAIIHVAALTDVWPSRSEIVRRVNIEGTKNIVAATKQANIKRLVAIGSASSCGFGDKKNLGNEEVPFKSHKYGLDYIDSKKEAQDYIIKEAKENGLPAIVVNPTFMFGAYDSKPGSGKMVKAIYEGKVPAYTTGGRNYVHAKDVAVAAVNALTMGRIGEYYIAGNRNMNYHEAFTLINDTIGGKSPKFKAPSWIIKTLGLVSSAVGTIFGITPTISYPMAAISTEEQYFSSQKAIDELGLPQTDLKIAIRECFEWMKANNVLDESK